MILAFVAVLVVVLDQVSKYAVKGLLVEGASVPVIDNLFHITYVRNTGAAFGLFPKSPYFLIVVSVVIIVGIFVYYSSHRPSAKLLNAALGLELGGAVGNLVDRLATGRVTDFLDFRIWPVFNVADSAIVVGGIVLGALLLFTKDGSHAKEAD